MTIFHNAKISRSCAARAARYGVFSGRPRVCVGLRYRGCMGFFGGLRAGAD